MPTTIESREEGREGDAQDQVQQDGGKSQNKRELNLKDVYIGSWRLVYSRSTWICILTNDYNSQTARI